MPLVQDERSNWRDQALAEVHNVHKIPLIPDGLGWLVIEYNHSIPIALINYEKAEKLSMKEKIDLQKHEQSINIISNLSLATKLPFFEVIYYYDGNEDIIKLYKIKPCNMIAEKEMAYIDSYVNFSEKSFVTFLYYIRKNPTKSLFINAKLNELKWKIGFSGKEEEFPYQIISKRHRDFGWDVPVVDLDFIAFNQAGNPKMLVEYKDCHSKFELKTKLNHPTLLTLSSFSNKAKIPFYLVVYKKQTTGLLFTVHPINLLAKQMYPKVLSYSENEYFDFCNFHISNMN